MEVGGSYDVTVRLRIAPPSSARPGSWRSDGRRPWRDVALRPCWRAAGRICPVKTVAVRRSPGGVGCRLAEVIDAAGTARNEGCDEPLVERRALGDRISNLPSRPAARTTCGPWAGNRAAESHPASSLQWDGNAWDTVARAMWPKRPGDAQRVMTTGPTTFGSSPKNGSSTGTATSWQAASRGRSGRDDPIFHFSASAADDAWAVGSYAFFGTTSDRSRLTGTATLADRQLTPATAATRRSPMLVAHRSERRVGRRRTGVEGYRG